MKTLFERMSEAQSQHGPQFTPGQWAPDKFGEIVSLGKNGKSICMVLQDAEGPANATLIAAAPDLFEAVRLFVEYDAGDEDDGVAMMLAYAKARDAAKAALAKARGEQ